MKPVLVMILLAWAISSAMAEPACRITDPELIGDFAGTCDADGLAAGPGAARGALAEYVGEFQRGMKHGHGVKIWKRSGDRYVGEFFSDVKQGRGIYSFGPGSAASGDYYVGEFFKDSRHGGGVYYWANGDSFSGQWEKGRLVGTATPMQTLRHLHLQELAEAVKKPGVRVCRERPVGIGGTSQLRGRVESVNGDDLQIRLESGTLVTQKYVEWFPCQ